MSYLPPTTHNINILKMSLLALGWDISWLYSHGPHEQIHNA